MNTIVESMRMLRFTLVLLVLALIAPSSATAQTQTKASCDAGYKGNVQSVNNDFDPQMKQMQERAAHLLAQGSATKDPQLKKQYNQQRDEALRRYDQLKAQKAARLSEAKAVYDKCLKEAVIAQKRLDAHASYTRKLQAARNEINAHIAQLKERLTELWSRENEIKGRLAALNVQKKEIETQIQHITTEKKKVENERQQLKDQLAFKERGLKEELDAILAGLK